jgi:aspartyl-tRNA(Asn)/glutamyl-tRNA(Gln) amidotransferase subunit B
MYLPTIGLEIHAELKTKTKMFCGCKNDPDENIPNTNVCPICLGHPGVLPTINQEALKLMVKIGLALQGKIANYSQFDRKSYFYPDLPKGYQISQYDYPIVENAILNNIRIKRIHLEEDAGKLIHEANQSLVDFNRAGVPLMELVTFPDIKTAEEAVAFAKNLQQILRYLNASDADMEKGQMRIEVNISLAKDTDKELGTKVEVKNINSFKAVYDAIQYEIERQIKVLKEGKKVIQETRGWDDIKAITVSQRKKEEANDYRYFPEPDLPPLQIHQIFNLGEIKKEIPELPEEKRKRFKNEYQISNETIEILVQDKSLAEYFENAVSELYAKIKNANPQLLANYLTSDILGLLKSQNQKFQDLKIKPEHLAHLIFLLQEQKLNSRLAKDILIQIFETGEDPENIINKNNLEILSDEKALEEIANEIIKTNPKSVSDYKNGKQNAIQFLVGQVMAKTKGKANPNVVRTILEKKLK